jgi:hypothetical protein
MQKRNWASSVDEARFTVVNQAVTLDDSEHNRAERGAVFLRENGAPFSVEMRPQKNLF